MWLTMTAKSDIRLPPNPACVEWRTILVIVCCIGLLGAVVLVGSELPLPATLVALAVLGAWYGSIQHEAAHGHPTPWPALNMILTEAPLGLVYPFWLYRDLHLTHHNDEILTDPVLDPESMYMSRAQWDTSGRLYRGVRNLNQTLMGRMLIGPFLCFTSVLRHLVGCLRTGHNRAGVVRWAMAVTLILVGVDAAGMPHWQFALGFGYGGLSITLIRSFAEHRDVPDANRSAVVHSRWFWGLLFLNNNLHVTHHRHPHLSWYELREAHDNSDGDLVAAAGAGLHRSYPALFARFMFRPVDAVVHQA